MMGTNYLELVMEELLDMERDDTYTLIEMVDSEIEYIHSCLENNSIVTEKAATKIVKNKKGVVARFIDMVKNLFGKFTAKAKEIANEIAPFKKEYLEELDKIFVRFIE